MGPPKENGTDVNGLSKAKLAKYQKEKDKANAKENETNPASQLKHPTRLGAFSSKPPLHSHGIVGSSNLIWDRLKGVFNNDARETTITAIGQCIYENGLPFNLVQSPYWAKMIKAANESPKGFKSPGYEKVRTTMPHS